MEFGEDDYKKIRGYCFRFLHKVTHDRHLEDLIQYVALKHWEKGGVCKWEWLCCAYCRENGLSNNSKARQGARALESSLSIDAPGPSDDSSDSQYLLNDESIERSEKHENLINFKDNFKGVLEEFLLPLGLKKETMRWTLKSYKITKANMR